VSPPTRLNVVPVYRKSARSAFHAAAGRRGGRPQFGRRSDNLRSSTSFISFFFLSLITCGS
jgi:hypothetical protein